MSKFMDDKTREELISILSRLENPVKLVYFTQQYPCPMCREQKQLLEDLAALSDKIKLEVYDFVKDGDYSMKYGIDKIPATVVMKEKDYGIRFYGITSGYEFSSLLEAVMMVSSGKTGLNPQLEELIRQLDVFVHLQVMVTLTCPYCPGMVHSAHQLAMASKYIRADMVDASEFPQLAKKYDVQGVPKTIINEDYSVEGQMPPEDLYLQILKKLKPDEFKRLEDSIREKSGERKIKQGEPGHFYETIIIGGGPAGMSAALYAARKEIDTLLMAKEIGGQITFTASVENYLGFPQIGGKEMAEQFRKHMERYPVSEFTGENATKVEKSDGKFIVTTEEGKQFQSSSVIYCAGKEYRRLNVPGEEPFIGHGIAFCATCDAPLYKGKKVAVVGGGNSAFTATRDLINFASKIHLIHRRDEFTAEPALIKEVKKAPNVKIHTNQVITEILGDEKLKGMKIRSTTGENVSKLEVDGIFLEIGLNPNSGPVKDLVDLNENKEIPVICDNATKVEGFYAAGDVTDVPEKQICIAVGDGAKAALSCHKYLLNKGKTHSTVEVGESWQ